MPPSISSAKLFQWFSPPLSSLKIWHKADSTVCVPGNDLVGYLFFFPLNECAHFSVCVHKCACVIEWVDQPRSQIADGEILFALGKNQVITGERIHPTLLTWSDRGKGRDFSVEWTGSLWIAYESITAYRCFSYHSIFFCQILTEILFLTGGWNF